MARKIGERLHGRGNYCNSYNNMGGGWWRMHDLSGGEGAWKDSGSFHPRNGLLIYLIW